MRAEPLEVGPVSNSGGQGTAAQEGNAVEPDLEKLGFST